MDRKAFVLLSGGLDSTTTLYQAIHDFCPKDMVHAYGDKDVLREILEVAFKPQLASPDYEGVNIDWVEAVSIDYGQRHLKETKYARSTCERLGIRHTVIPVGNIITDEHTMLSKESLGSVEVPDISYAEIQGVSPTYVPFRNGFMLSILAAHAQKYVNSQIDEAVETSIHQATEQGMVCTSDEQDMYYQALKQTATNQARDLCGIYAGMHADDALNWAYPDCTPEFLGAMANAIYVGTYYTVRLYTPIQWMLKDDVVRLGSRLGVPFENTWSCYKGEKLHCGVCPTCRSRREAFSAAGVDDPTQYAGGN